MHLSGADQQLSRPLADAAHRFDGVDDQVEDHLLQLDSISLNERQALRELRLHRDAVLHHFASGQGNDLEDRFVDLQAILPWGRLLDEGTDPADDVAGSLAVLDDATERLPDLLQIRRLGAKPAQGGIGIGDCRRNWLADFMGNRGRQLPHRRDAIDVRELHLCLAQRFRRQHQLVGPFHDTLFELLIESA